LDRVKGDNVGRNFAAEKRGLPDAFGHRRSRPSCRVWGLQCSVARCASTPGRQHRRSRDTEAVEGDVSREPSAASVATFFISRILEQTESALRHESTRPGIA
jgi:hypothetical protein